MKKVFPQGVPTPPGGTPPSSPGYPELCRKIEQAEVVREFEACKVWAAHVWELLRKRRLKRMRYRAGMKRKAGNKC